ncbi:MAG: hypothetical protein H6729_00095 [Deltaproteobacteria bacterium]|nr:hypothetical protein [Deltaproteobacteria bacterium]
MDYQDLVKGRETVIIKNCKLEVQDGQLVIVEIKETFEVPASSLPTPDVATRRLNPGEAILVEDVLYAWVHPHGRAPEPSKPARESSSADDVEQETPPVAPLLPSFEELLKSAVSPDPERRDPVSDVERLTRLSYEALERNDRLIERHMKRLEYLDERQRKLDLHANAISDAQVKQLGVLREITTDVAASVRQMTQFPQRPALPEEYVQARARLAAASHRQIPMDIVMQGIGSFIRGAGVLFPDPE